MAATTSNRRVLDFLTAFGGFGVVVAGVAMMDERARRFLAQAARGDFQVPVGMPDLQVHSWMRMGADMIGRDHMEIAIFAVASFVLFLFAFKL
jgi:hypothetical protein